MDNLLKERINRLHYFSESGAPEHWKDYCLRYETYLIIRSLFPGRFSALKLLFWRIKVSRVAYHYNSLILFLHRLGWCAVRDDEGRCLICDPYYECECEDCESSLEV